MTLKQGSKVKFDTAEDLQTTISKKLFFYCVNTSYPMDNLLNRSAQTGPPNVRKRRPVFPLAGRSVVLCTPQMAPHTSFLSRQPDVIASFSFGACTVQMCFQHLQKVFLMAVFSTSIANILLQKFFFFFFFFLTVSRNFYSPFFFTKQTKLLSWRGEGGKPPIRIVLLQYQA